MPSTMHREPVVSIVIAARDDAATIRRALESIQNQTLRSHETIVVDGGSTDGTAGIVDNMAQRDLTISLAQADGCGLAAALDLGMSRARGHYLVFFDASGWANPGMLADLVGAAEESLLELTIAGYSATVVGDGHRQDSVEANQPACVFPTQHDFRAGAWQLFEGNLLTSPCAKLFLRSRVERLGLSFADGDGDCTDALSFIAGYVRDVERVGLTGNIRYHVECRSPQRVPGFSVRDYRALERQYGTLGERLLRPLWPLRGRAPPAGWRDGLHRPSASCCRRGTPPRHWRKGHAGPHQVRQRRPCLHRGVSRLVHEAWRREGPGPVLHVAVGVAADAGACPWGRCYSPSPVRPLRCRMKLVIENHV